MLNGWTIRRRATAALIDLGFGLAIALVGGCAKPPPPPPPPTVIRGSLMVDPGANPDGNGRPSPIVVRIVELKSLALFENGDFFALWDRAKETLGADLVSTEEYDLRPGEERKFERMPGADARYFGVLAAYRDLERSSWRSTVPIVANQTQSVAISVAARKVSLSRR